MAKLHSTRTTHQLAYRAIRIEGGLIPADELTRLTLLADPKASEQTEAQYRIARGLKLRDEIARDFKIALNLWQDFQALRQRQDVRAHDVTVREWLLPLLRDVLHFHDAARCPAIEHDGRQYAIGHAGNGGRVPLVFAGFDQPLDAAAERFGETNPDTGKTRRRSPFMLAQEALNASDASLWAIVSNGLTLRILRDNPSLTRPAYIEVDLEALFTEELLADFSAFWLLTHASRFAGATGNVDAPVSDCPWERWRAAGQQTGVTVRGKLRYQVAEALRALGTGFLSNPANGALRAALQSADSGYDRQAFFEELLRLVYRFIFLATVEDRRDRATGEHLVFTPDAAADAKARYLAGYSLTWLRERAVRRSQHDRHADLWQALTITFGALARGEPALGPPALGGLFDLDQCPHLDIAQLDNRHLLAAVFQLGWFRADGGLSRVNYRDMGPEELGSVYESLLELVPDLQGISHPAGARLAFVGDDETDASTKGNTRKLTGSYYTPDSLVQELIKSALEPVITQTVKANPQRPVEALLALTVCDPACGSGHFLLSAARRLADEVALHRAAAEREGGAPTPADYRHALRDVVSRCIYGVDKNPMAIQLAKTALWLEAYSPDRPLSFVDHHLRVGDALLGVLDPKVLEHGIPDEAYTALSGDDKAVASALKKQNKADLKSWRNIASGDWVTPARYAAQLVAADMLDDGTTEQLAAKREAWRAADVTAHRSTFARLADTLLAAFLAPKLGQEVDVVPLSGYLWGVLNGQPANAEVEDAAHELCRKHSVFHWWLAFPQVAARGGFDVMLGNPPWEMLQLDPQEFFAAEAPSIANAQHMSARDKLIEALRTERPHLHARYWSAVRGMEAVQAYVHASGRYPHSGFGRINLASLFAETCLQATRLSNRGRAGMVLPSGIATDSFTQHLFNAIAAGNLVSLYDFENRERIFPAVDSRMKFCLMTIGRSSEASFQFFSYSTDALTDARRRFRLTPADFALLNPNTRTCPVFRSQADAELTKKLYRATPVLWREELKTEAGDVVQTEDNPWSLQFQLMFMMNTDSGLFRDAPAPADQHIRLPLYEGKMIHQFDHRWATYVDVAGGAPGTLETADFRDAAKADPNVSVRTRYWVDEREVLARIARVPARVAKAWLLTHNLGSYAEVDDEKSLEFSIASWLAGEWMRRLCPDELQGKNVNKLAQAQWRAIAEIDLAAPPLLAALRRTKGGEDLTNWLKWAHQDGDTPFGTSEEKALRDWQESFHGGSNDGTRIGSLLRFVDEWMDRRSPRWLMGWRDITNATNERTVISSVAPRVGVGNNMPLMLFGMSTGHELLAALLGNLCSLSFDFVARHKVGGTHLNFFIFKQLPVLSPERYPKATLEYIVPRVLELTYTAHDLKPWADDLAAYDPRPVTERGQPFAWNLARRAQLRAELDAYYARLYGLTREELRYILDPKEVMGDDYPSETFRVLKEGEIRNYGEYRTRRLVLEAWDELHRT